MTSALAGRRIVVTRAAEQANDLAALLQEVGAVPVVIPLIEIVTDVTEVARLADLAGLADKAGGAFASFDWLIVTSPNGAEHVVDVVNAVNRPLECCVGAIGATTAQVLRAGGFEVALVPAVQSAVGLLAEMAPAGSVLLVQGANAEATLADGLRERGSAVTVVAPYSTAPSRVSAGQQLAALAADAVLFASGSAARAWVDVFGDSTPPVVVAIGPRTAAVVTDAGLKVSIVAADHSLTGMVVALERHLSSQR